MFLLRTSTYVSPVVRSNSSASSLLSRIKLGTIESSSSEECPITYLVPGISSLISSSFNGGFNPLEGIMNFLAFLYRYSNYQLQQSKDKYWYSCQYPVAIKFLHKPIEQ